MPYRRLVTIPGYLLAWVLWIAAAPVWIPLCALLDLSRRAPAVALRSGLMIAAYLTCEAVGLALSGGLWLWKCAARPEPARWEALHFALEAAWGNALFLCAARIFGMRLEVDAQCDLSRGPYILLVRHTSTADTLLASALISRPLGMRLRYVLKREHLLDPCLDVVGNRVPNAFVDRSARDSATEIERVAALGRGLGSKDAVLLYPEGTRFSEAKRARVIARCEQLDQRFEAQYARSLVSVLPPRTGGVLSLLEAAPHADVVICAHVGLAASASLGTIWNGGLVGAVVRVRLHRIARADIPDGRNARIEWLREEWRRLDAWVVEACADETRSAGARAR